MTNSQFSTVLNFKKQHGFGGFTRQEVAEKCGVNVDELNSAVVKHCAQHRNRRDAILKQTAEIAGLDVENYTSGEKRKHTDYQKLQEDVLAKLPDVVNIQGKQLPKTKIEDALREIENHLNEWKFKDGRQERKSKTVNLFDLLGDIES